MMDEMLLRMLIQRIDLMILLELERKPPEGRSVSMVEKISRLDELGLSASEIAKITRKSINYVTAILSRKRKGTKKK